MRYNDVGFLLCMQHIFVQSTLCSTHEKKKKLNAVSTVFSGAKHYLG